MCIRDRDFDLTVKHVAGKLNVVPDVLSRLFGDVEEESFPQEPALASICRTFQAIDRTVSQGRATSKFPHKTSKMST